MQDFRNLAVWAKAHVLTLSVYKQTVSFPKEELYGLTSQTRSSCSSIPANIAEGCGKDGDNEFKRFLRIAQGSASELDYHLILARDLKYLPEKEYEELASLVGELRRMLAGLIKRITTQ